MKVTLSWRLESDDEDDPPIEDAVLEIDMELPFPPFIGMQIELPSPQMWADDGPTWLAISEVCWVSMESRFRCEVKEALDVYVYGNAKSLRKIVDALTTAGWRVVHRSKRLLADSRI